MNILSHSTRLTGPSKLLAASLLGLLVTFSGCKDDDADPPHSEQELITTVTLRLVDAADASDVATISFRDLDGEGGSSPVYTPDTLVLKPNTAYKGTLTLMDESDAGHSHDLTAEVKAEGTAHQVFYTPGAGLNLTTSSTDKDSRNLPIGLEADFVAGATSSGTLRVVLGHFDASPKNGTDLLDAESDVDVTFKVRIR